MRTMGRFKFILFVPLIIGGLALFSYVTMLLWNALLPVLFHFPLITFWQSVGLLILTRLLFGSFGHHGRGHHRHWGNDLRDKWGNMTPEEREEFLKRRYENRSPWACHFGDRMHGGPAETENK